VRRWLISWQMSADVLPCSRHVEAKAVHKRLSCIWPSHGGKVIAAASSRFSSALPATVDMRARCPFFV
jgi:hypothetical protein